MRLGIIVAVAMLSVSAFAAPKTFVYCTEGSPTMLNPQLATDGPSFGSAQQIYDRLLDFEVGTTNLIPGLAESWTVSKDGKVVTLKLRSGVKFHSSDKFKPTRDFNADDVLFSFERMRDRNHPYHKVGGAKYPLFESLELRELIRKVEKVDPMTVRFSLAKTDATFLSNLAVHYASILSAEYGDKMMKAGTPEILDLEPIGTGPFVFKKYEKDNMIRFVANDTYWRGRPKIDQLVFAITPEASVRKQKIKQGECDMIAHPAPADLAALGSDPSVNVLEKEGRSISYLAFNNSKAPFKDVRVRRAINHAMNRKSYIEAIYLGKAEMAKGPVPSGIWSSDDKSPDHEYNPEKAKALLKEAGFEKGFETTLWSLPIARPYNPDGKKLGELMQADLAKVGIKVNLQTYDWPTYLAKARAGEHDMLMMGWTSTNGDPDSFLRMLLSCSADVGVNYSRWCDKKYDTLVTKGKEVLDRQQRTKLYLEAQGVFMKEVPWVTIAYGKVHRAVRSHVQGFVIDPIGDRFDRLDLVDKR